MITFYSFILFYFACICFVQIGAPKKLGALVSLGLKVALPDWARASW